MGDRDWMFQDEKIERLFEPDIMMPAQFYGRVVHRARETGERRLMAAILEDAVHTLCDRGHRRAPRELRAARRWIESHDRQWVFSFERICEALDVDPEHVREQLRSRSGRIAVIVGVEPMRGNVPRRKAPDSAA
ncbi:MAG TPA: hypothetical protein VKW76_07260 [Candidatus Binatia bacterium]|nr:hypothetical protein [Candidatus Binatia bacterium]